MLAVYDEINNIKTELRETYIAQTAEGKRDRKYYEDTIFDLLVLAWLMGVDDANADLDIDENPNVDAMERCINRRIDGKTYIDRIDEHLDNDDIEGILRVADTEAMHSYNDGKQTTAEQFVEHTEGEVPTNVLKTWNTMLDDRVRETHQYIEGVTVPLDAEFYTFDGDHAMYPTGFTKAENCVGCRCWLTYSKQ